MIHGARMSERMTVRGLSQSELARRIGISQQTIHKLITGASRGSTHIARIARELGTTPAFLEGEIDDPDEGAPPPRLAVRHQPVMLPVMLPAEAALAAAFQGVLLASEGMNLAELSLELAKRLPIVLRMSAGSIVEPASARADDLPAPDELLAASPRARRRA